MLTIVCALMYISYYCYSTVFENDSICSTIKLRLRDAGFETHLSFHVWNSRNRQYPFTYSNSTFIKFIHVKTQQNILLFFITTRIKVHEARVVYMQKIQYSLIYFHFLKHNQLKWQSYAMARQQCCKITHNDTPKYL